MLRQPLRRLGAVCASRRAITLRGAATLAPGSRLVERMSALLRQSGEDMENILSTETHQTKIVATVGPASWDEETLAAILACGVDVFRLNCSHGSHDEYDKVIGRLERLRAKDTACPFAIAIDTKGPEIRTGLNLDGNDVVVDEGAEMVLVTDPAEAERGTAARQYIDYPQLAETVAKGSTVFLDDGLLRLKVKAISGGEVVCESMNRALLGQRKGVNLPGASVQLPAVSEQDVADISWASAAGVDAVFASFVRQGSHVAEVRRVAQKARPPDMAPMRVFSKVENQEGVDNISEILRVSDGVMVARGDLGIEIPPELVVVAQKLAIRKCNQLGKPVICATQMLESMVQNPRPTRAEVSDIANAVLDGADCVMLSGETATGRYPLMAVRAMARACRIAEQCGEYQAPSQRRLGSGDTAVPSVEAVAAAAVQTAVDQGAKLMVVVTETGDVARLVSKYRPPVPVVAATSLASVAQQTRFHRGVVPVVLDSFNDVETILEDAVRIATERGMCRSGDAVVVVHDQNVNDEAEEANVMRVLPVP